MLFIVMKLSVLVSNIVGGGGGGGGEWVPYSSDAIAYLDLTRHLEGLSYTDLLLNIDIKYKQLELIINILVLRPFQL